MKNFFTILSLLGISSVACAQSITSAYTVSAPELRGTARFMSMGGAFGALGGDLSCIGQNPGGIGIYRSNEIGLTLDLDAQEAKSQSFGFSTSDNTTRFNLNNLGAVFTMKLYNDVMPNINFGFTYNKAASFNRHYKGGIPNLNNSISNYIAGLCNSGDLNEADVSFGDSYNPYNPPAGSRNVPWLTVLGYYGFLTTPEGDADAPHWYGQFGEGTTGTGAFDVLEKGSIDEYNIALGGNINNKVFWGMDFDITTLDYRIQSAWSESLDKAYVYDPNREQVVRTSSDFTLYDNYKMSGTGFNFKLGVIVKPIQELRLGLAFHTPTFYTLTETYSDTHLNFKYPFKTQFNSEYANDGYPVANDFNFRTPWRVIASVAGVIGSNFIISADYEWDCYKSMKFSEADPWGYSDPWYDWDNPWNGWGDWYYAPSKSSIPEGAPRANYNNPNDYANAKIKEIYQNTSTIRLGAEYRVIPSFSLRAGYGFTTSPVTADAKDLRVEVPGTGLMTNYTLNNTTSNISCGFGYKTGGFYADFAYVFRHSSSEYFPYAPDIYDPANVVKSKLTFNTSNIVMSVGYKF